MSQSPVRDLRYYARQTTVRLIIGGLLVLFLIGDGLIWAFFGKEAALSGLLCIGMGLFPLVLIAFVLFFINWVAQRANKD